MIEGLQNHDNSEIYKLAFDIIEKFFSTDEEETNIINQTTTALSAIQNNQFVFEPTQQNVPDKGFSFN